MEKSIYQAEQGVPEAAFRLAQYYTFAQPSTKERIAWLRKASHLGHLRAKYNLAFYYEHEINPPRYKAAIELYQELAKKGDGDAMCALGQMYEDGRGVDVSTKKATAWYEKAAYSGKVFSMEKLASLLANQNAFDSAYLWARIAAIRRNRAQIRTNNVLVSISSKLDSEKILGLNKRAEELDKTVPYIAKWELW
jgi:TPR repeat protein